MDFSVIIASRNRPALLLQAIQSVLVQTHASVEIVVVNDGSDGDNVAAYQKLDNELPDRVRFFNMPQVSNGHGQSFGINRGAEISTGKYVCFLDDDDFWTDPNHLERAFKCLQADPTAEVYLSNQIAYKNDIALPGPIWLEPVAKIARMRGARKVHDALVIIVDDLIKCGSHCHFNTTIVSRDLFQRIKGLDQFIRYENDRDFYLRYLDKATGILYYPGFVSHHRVPDTTQKENSSTRTTFLEKMFYRTYIYNKARLFSTRKEIRRFAAIGQGYTLRVIASDLISAGRIGDAFSFAREALAVRFGIKWLLY
jgi:glycosyltransferase involved in cell wall biosynthesis